MKSMNWKMKLMKKEQLFEKKAKREERKEREEQVQIDHNEAMKVLKFDNENKNQSSN